MKNVKFIAGFSCFGFLLSFISGFASRGNNFGRIVIHAVIFAAVFAVLAVVIDLVFGKVLDIEGDISYEAQSGENSGNSASAPSSHAVDITVQDEDLPSEENAPQFFVGSGRNMLNPDDVKTVVTEPKSETNENAVSAANVVATETKTVGESADVNKGFVPVTLGETPSNISSVEAKTQAEVDSSEQKRNSVSAMTSGDAGDGDLDSLPDLEDLTGYQQSNTPIMDEDSIAETSDSSDMGSVSTVSAEEVTSGQDVELMAKAISTLLKKE